MRTANGRSLLQTLMVHVTFTYLSVTDHVYKVLDYELV